MTFSGAVRLGMVRVPDLQPFPRPWKAGLGQVKRAEAKACGLI